MLLVCRSSTWLTDSLLQSIKPRTSSPSEQNSLGLTPENWSQALLLLSLQVQPFLTYISGQLYSAEPCTQHPGTEGSVFPSQPETSHSPSQLPATGAFMLVCTGMPSRGFQP